jgi:O-antigen ligase
MPTRYQLPGLIFAILPISLFFPIGITYALIVLYFITWLSSGGLRERWVEIRRNPVYTPNLILLAIVFLSVLLLSGGNEYRWYGIIHYLVFIFFLLFASGCADADYQRAKLVFFGGALYAGCIFCLARLDVLPDWVIFSYYHVYAGNKSISIGIFMAIAAAWMLDEVFNTYERRKTLLLLAAFAFTATVVVQFAVTRTGTLLVYLLCALVILRRVRFNTRALALVAVASGVIIGVAISDGVGNRRLQSVAAAATAFKQGDIGTGESNRLQFLKVTGEMIAEKPILGFGIGGWRQQYPARAAGMETAFMSTPHNDYLLYGAELGAAGLIALGLIIAALVKQALRISSGAGNSLLMVVAALSIGSMFNAILRDWRFGLPMMLLLAIAYRETDALSGASPFGSIPATPSTENISLETRR